jgi:hypothetical protein
MPTFDLSPSSDISLSPFADFNYIDDQGVPTGNLLNGFWQHVNSIPEVWGGEFVKVYRIVPNHVGEPALQVDLKLSPVVDVVSGLPVWPADFQGADEAWLVLRYQGSMFSGNPGQLNIASDESAGIASAFFTPDSPGVSKVDYYKLILNNSPFNNQNTREKWMANPRIEFNMDIKDPFFRFDSITVRLTYTAVNPGGGAGGNPWWIMDGS